MLRTQRASGKKGESRLPHCPSWWAWVRGCTAAPGFPHLATGPELAMLRQQEGQQEGQGRIQGGTSGRTRGAQCGTVSRLRKADQAGVAVQVPGRWRPHSCQPAGHVTALSRATGGAQAGGSPGSHDVRGRFGTVGPDCGRTAMIRNRTKGDQAVRTDPKSLEVQPARL